jgi:iron(III) transport system substrate-binding protein
MFAGLAAIAAATACGGDEDSITVYSGRSETLVGPLLDQYNEEAEVGIEVRYAGTPELAATILEEGDNSPADVFFAQDAGSLGALAAEGKLEPLPDDILALVPEAYRSPDGLWVGVSGRARVVVYNTEALSPDDLPASILDYTGPEWEGRIGWAPTNASFQSFVTGLRQLNGEEAAAEWLRGIRDNGAVDYPNNTSVVQAVADGEVEVGFVNHYYLFQFLEEAGEGFGARNSFFAEADPGGLVNIAGVAVLKTAENKDEAFDFIRFLLGDASQQYFRDETFEYPMAAGVDPVEGLPPLASLAQPNIDLGDLADLRGTVALLEETGVLP